VWCFDGASRRSRGRSAWIRSIGHSPVVRSRAELALEEICSRLGYCDALARKDVFFADRPKDADAFVDAVLLAEGMEPQLVPISGQRRALLDIVDKWAVYDDRPTHDELSRPRFPSAD
jgi:hypothetical protein